MKIRSIALAAVALAMMSCGGGMKKAAFTTISGTVEDTTLTEVRVTVASPKLDTVLTIENGKFAIEVPESEKSYGMIILMEQGRGKYGSYYIPDGTNLTVAQKAEDVTVVSDKEGANNAYSQYVEALSKIYVAESDTMVEELEALWTETVKSNPDNGIAILVISDASYYLTPEKKIGLIDLLDESIKEDKKISSIIASANAQKNTAEGMMFTDFTVEHVYGYDRSVDPQPLKKEVKFSDYVGKGKYVLVDFWSPWCGPCRREMPNIKTVYEQYKDKGLEVLSLAVWERKPQSHTIEVAGELGMDWLHINNCGKIPTDIYGVEGIPHLMLVGPDGTILKRGFHGLEGIQAAVAEYIK